ncbi:hypothetical protein [uncultured Duncaniella sp.]|uniref:hypothetical protein n=3 Tax=uncultured Duncaniella sp. TaxID=2768039 RepID=UPI0025E43798|nr:hypothetical protein [uncultured Duncaniella sp.]
MVRHLILPAITASAVMAGCSTHKEVSDGHSGAVGWNKSLETEQTDSTSVIFLPGNGNTGVRDTRPSAVVPMAKIYKTNGDYAERVPVMLNASRTALVSYPAPSDLRDSEPVKLDDGFLLDRRGVGVNTAFTRWTYKEYSEMTTPPSPEEIMANLIPEARVTELYEMPFPASTPDAPARCNTLITTGLPGCKSLILRMKL